MAQATPPPKPPGSPEDIRAAANVQVSICTFVLTAGLAIIAAEAGLTTFYLEHRVLHALGLAGLVTAALFIVVGWILGGKALTSLSESGYYGEWDFFATANLFNWQAITTLIAALLVVAVAAWGSASSSDSPEKATMRTIETRMEILDKRVDSSQLGLRQEENSMKAIQKRITTLEKRASSLRQCSGVCCYKK